VKYGRAQVTLEQWQQRHGVSDLAVRELQALTITESLPDTYSANTPETTIQAAIRVEAANLGMVLWRNNAGMAFDQKGNPIRFGLANDSQQVNRRVKSADLIGIRPVLITPPMVSTTIGQFVAREVKRGSWTYKGTDREKAQKKFLDICTVLGADGRFANGPGTL
jgi:hypothetical protein